MENNPISVMLHEHKVISSAEKIIEHLENTWINSPDTYKKTVLDLLGFFRKYADGYHHRKEEDVLFPKVNQHPEFVIHEILDEFEQHHEDFRTSIEDIEKAIENDEYEKSYKELSGYMNDLLDHVAAENEELFVLAESLLNEDELETIFFLFKDIDLELGEDEKAELEAFIKTLTVHVT